METEPSDAQRPVAPTTITDQPLAHLDEVGRPHLLIEHLEAVGELAARFGEPIAAAQWARLAGRWHDLGKYARDFQQMIRAANGFEAHLEGGPTGRVDHSSAGAVHALEVLGPQGAPLAFAIAGHHAGLPNLQDLQDRRRRKQGRLADARTGGAPAEILRADAPEPPAWLRQGTPDEQRRRLELWTRIIFSALCDADFLDTEAFFDAGRAALRGGGEPIDDLRRRLAGHLSRLQAAAPDTEVNRVRAEVLRACLDAAARPPGAFSLTVPTGGGKTLASMAFALEHAARHGMERVIVAIPYGCGSSATTPFSVITAGYEEGSLGGWSEASERRRGNTGRRGGRGDERADEEGGSQGGGERSG